MNIFNVKKVLQRLDRMVNHAINGGPVETEFDETKMSAIETKLNRFLLMTKTKQEQMEEEKRKIKELISDISHQTKTPIANLMLYSSLLSEQGNLSDDHRKLIDEIRKQSEKLNFLIDSLIKTSRLETGIIALNPTENNLDDLLKDAVNQVNGKASQKNISIAFHYTGLHCNFDYKWTLEAIYNILDNAVKYTKEHGRITITVTPYELFYSIHIEDNGIGINIEEQNKVFQRFYRSLSGNDSEGVGIGLYLAREIIERQSGYIKLNSSVGEGSTFSIFLPK